MLERWKLLVSFVAGLVLAGWGAFRWSESGFPLGSRTHPAVGAEYLYFTVLGVALLATGLFKFTSLQDRTPLPVRCPSCGSSVAWHHVTLDKPFFCPSCQQGISLSGAYFRVVYGLSAATVGVTAYLFGARGEVLFYLVVLGTLPTHAVVVYPALWLVAPAVSTTGDLRGILHGDSAIRRAGFDSLSGQDSTATEPSPNASGSTPAGSSAESSQANHPVRSIRPPTFVQLVPAVSIDGLFLKIGGWLVVGYGVWIVVRAIIERLR